MLQYRPANVFMLRGAFSRMQKRNHDKRYLGDLLWKLVGSQFKGFEAPSFSEYQDMLSGKQKPARLMNAQETWQAASDMLGMFLQQ